MADNTPNKKDIKDAQEALDQYNDALRESSDLAKIISNNIALLAGGMNRVGLAGRSTVGDLKEYGKALSKTIDLSAKLTSGKLKEKEATDQINKLQAAYKKYITEANEQNSYITQNKKAQENLEKELSKLAESKGRSELKNEELYKKQIQLTKDLEKSAKRQATAVENGNTALLAQEEAKSKVLSSELKTTNALIAEQTRSLNNTEKTISAKKQELDRVEAIVNAHEDLTKQYEEEIKKNQILLEQLKEQNSFSGALKKIFGDVKDKISDSLKPMSLITTAFEFLKNLAFAVSDQTTQLQKNLVLTKDEAYGVRQEFNLMAMASNDVAINTSRLLEANASLGKQLGFNSKFTADLNIQFVKLTKQLGLSEEAAGGLAKLSIATGSTLEESKNIAYETTQALSSQYGIQLSQREVLEEVGKLSGQILAMFKANPQALTEAVAQAKLLGTNLTTAAKQAESLLDFETSIQNELQAELLTGQQFNLERARSAALTGDLTTAMKELTNQNIDFNKFSNMNVIAQEKVASALGLSTDELADQLLKQQYMNMSREQVVALAGEEVAERVEALNAQDKFNLAVEKMQDLIGALVSGPLGTFVDMMASLAENSALVFTAMGALAALSFTKLVTGLAASAVQAGLLAVGTAATASAITLGVGAAAIAIGIGTMMAAYNQAKEEAVQPTGDMFSSNGKTVVSTKEGGLFELSNNDELMAAPGLGDMISNANRQTVVTQDNSALIEEIRALKNEMAGTKDGINQLNRKEGIVKINGQVAGTAQMMGNYNLA